MKPKVLITGSSTGIGKACALSLTTKLASQFVPDKVRDFFVHQEIKI